MRTQRAYKEMCSIESSTLNLLGNLILEDKLNGMTNVPDTLNKLVTGMPGTGLTPEGVKPVIILLENEVLPPYGEIPTKKDEKRRQRSIDFKTLGTKYLENETKKGFVSLDKCKKLLNQCKVSSKSYPSTEKGVPVSHLLDAARNYLASPTTSFEEAGKVITAIHNLDILHPYNNGQTI